VAVFAGVFGVMARFGASPAAIVLLPLSGLIFWRVQRRRKALMHAVATALTAAHVEA
jgi:hypothetical protein